MATLHNEKVLERCQVSPPGVPATALPLTVFDIFFYPLEEPVQRVFFYKLPPITFSTFLDSHLPNLKQSLVPALQRFYPLAGRMVPANGGRVPSSLSYTEVDWVELTVAERYDDFECLTQDGPKDASLLHGLAPVTLNPDKRGQPVLSLKVTLYPSGHGVAVGVSTHHAAVDGQSSIHFIKTWASFCRGADGNSCLECPMFDRSVIKDPQELGKAILKGLEERYRHVDASNRSAEADESTAEKNSGVDAVLATFRLSKAQLEGLRRWVAAKEHGPSARFSSFSLATALVWSAWVKMRRVASDGGQSDEWLLFPYDVRGRYPEAAIPLSYFGNCVGSCLVKASTAELLGEDGVVVAAAAVRKAVGGLGPDDVMGGMKCVSQFFREAHMTGTGTGNVMTVAGSPRLGVYGVDFGWGQPVKVEIVSIGATGAMSLAEGKEEGSLVVGLVLPKSDMEEFAVKFADGLSLSASCVG